MKKYAILIISFFIGAISLSAQQDVLNRFFLLDTNKRIGVIDSEITPFTRVSPVDDTCSQIYFSIINPFPDSVFIIFFTTSGCAWVEPNNNVTLAPNEEKIFRLIGFCKRDWKQIFITVSIEFIKTKKHIGNEINVLYNMNVYREWKSRQEQTKENRK